MERLTKVQRNNLKDIICDVVGSTYNEAFLSDTRKREAVMCRQIFCWMLKKYTRSNLTNIGKFLYDTSLFDYNHSTVIHGIKTTNNLMDTDRLFNEQVKRIEFLFKIKVKNSYRRETSKMFAYHLKFNDIKPSRIKRRNLILA